MPWRGQAAFQVGQHAAIQYSVIFHVIFARAEMHQARRSGLQFEVYGALGFALPGCSAPRTWHITLKDFREIDELFTISAYKSKVLLPFK